MEQNNVDELETRISELETLLMDFIRRFVELESRLNKKDLSTVWASDRLSVKNLNIPKSIGQSFGTIKDIRNQ